MDAIDEDNSRVRSGLLPAFFARNVKSPTVGSLTGTGYISFTPVIQTDSSKNLFNDEGTGLEIDMREVYFNVDGS